MAGHTSRRGRAAWPLLLLALCACASRDDDARTTGSGGSLARYSSTQKTVDLTPQQRAALLPLQDHYYPGLDGDAALAQAAAALRQMQFKPVQERLDAALVEGELDTSLVSRSHEILRGVLKQKLPFLPKKPDHQSTRALVAVRPGLAAGTLVHLELEDTVWDSNGDSVTTEVTAAQRYQDFFGRLGAAPQPD
jgi:hypothetical protein